MKPPRQYGNGQSGACGCMLVVLLAFVVVLVGSGVLLGAILTRRGVL